MNEDIMYLFNCRVNGHLFQVWNKGQKWKFHCLESKVYWECADLREALEESINRVDLAVSLLNTMKGSYAGMLPQDFFNKVTGGDLV